MAGQIHTPPRSQRVEDTNPRGKSFVLHTLSVTVMLNGFLALNQLAFGDHVAPQYGGFWQFLTILGLLASGVTMTLAAISDLLPAIPIIRTLKRTLMLFAMPVELVISSIYWPIVIFTPHLMLPPLPQSTSTSTSTGTEPSSEPSASLFYIPLWMDLSMHALPAFVLLFDFMFLEKKFKPPQSTYGATALAVSFGTAYSVWVEHCAKINGSFPYPFLTVMDLPGRITLYVVATFGALSVFWGLNKIHR